MDRCNNTTFTVTVRAGRSYTARPRRR